MQRKPFGFFLLLLVLFPLMGMGRKTKSKNVEQVLEIFSEQPTVSAGSKIPVPESRAPYSVSVISSKDIQRYQATNFENLLERIPGVDVFSQNDSLSYMDIRGILDSSLHEPRTLFLIDGIPTWVSSIGINLMDSLPVSLEDIAQIEVIRTPTTVSGANAVEGIISITTKKPADDSGVRFRVGTGSQGTWEGFLGYGDVIGRFSYHVSLSDYLSDVWRPASYDSVGQIPPIINPYSRRFKLSTQLNYAMGNEEWNVYFGRGVEGGVFGGYPFIVDFSFPHNLVAATYTNHLGKDSKLTVRFSHDQLSADINAAYLGAPAQSTFEESRDELGFEHYFPWAGSQIFSWGGEYFWYDTTGSTNPTPPFIIPPTKPSLSIESTMVRASGWGAYFQNKSSLTPNDALYYGGRYDQDWTGENGFAPFISYVHSLTPGVSIRGNINVAYRFPDVTELYANFTPAVIPTSSPLPPLPFVFDFYGANFAHVQRLLPERVTNYEVAYGGRFSENFTAHLEFYDKSIDNYIDRRAFVDSPATCLSDPLICSEYPPFETDGLPVLLQVSFPRNIPRVNIAGGELSMEYEFDPLISIYGNYRNQSANWRLLPSQAALLGIPVKQNLYTSPRSIGTIGLKFTGDGWNGFLEGRSQSLRDIFDFGQDIFIPGYTEVNLGFNVKVAEKLEVGIVSYNVFNHVEESPVLGTIIGGRYQLQLEYGF